MRKFPTRQRSARRLKCCGRWYWVVDSFHREFLPFMEVVNGTQKGAKHDIDRARVETVMNL